MSTLKRLAGQTFIYGVSTMVPRFLQSLMTWFYVRYLPDTVAQNGVLNYIYSCIPFLLVIFTYGMETAFFRFSESEKDEKRVYSTSCISIIGSTLVLVPLLLIFNRPIADFAHLPDHPEFVMLIAGILGMDTLCAIPFASLRQQNRPVKYAILKIVNTVIYIFFTVFFYVICPLLIKHGYSFAHYLYDPSQGVKYALVANFIASTSIFLLLLPELLSVKLHFDPALWRRMMTFTLPLLIVGLAGVINDTMDKVLLRYLLPLDNAHAIEEQIGIYGNCYKLVLLISLLRQAFQYAADPFFFQHASKENARETYARVMKYFVMVMCIGFLCVVLFIDAWKFYIGSAQHPAFWQGLKIVPIVLVGYMCLGVNYNLSIWYKLTDQTKFGAIISVIGAVLTLAINIIFIPVYGYMACAWATLISYATIMILSYLLGQKYYPIPYDVKRIAVYFVAAFGIFLVFYFIRPHIGTLLMRYAAGLAGLALYGLFLYKMEEDDIRRLLLVRRRR